MAASKYNFRNKELKTSVSNKTTPKKFSANQTLKVPSISEQLAELKPSKELVSYYQEKISKCQDEWDEIIMKLDEYGKLYDNEHKLEKELQIKNDEIILLQKALSDIQLSLFQEREHVLHLYMENDRLKIQEIEDRKKIHYLLEICEHLPESYKMSNLKDIAKFHLEEPKILPHPEPIISRKKNETISEQKISTGIFKFNEQKLTQNCTESMKYEIEALKVQLEERESLFHQQIDALTNDCNITKQEAEIQRLRDSEHIKHLTEKLKQTTKLLQQTTRDYVNFRKSIWNTETNWSLERAKLIDEINSIKMNIKKQKEKYSLIEELSVVKHELEGYNQQTYLLDEISKLKQILNQFTIPLIEEMKLIREQLTKCVEQVELQKELCNNSIDLRHKTSSPLKKQLFQQNCEQLKNNLTSLSEQITDITEQAKLVYKKNSEEETEILKLQNAQKESLLSINEYLNNIKETLTSLEQSSQDNSMKMSKSYDCMKMQLSGESVSSMNKTKTIREKAGHVKNLRQDANELTKITEEYKAENIFLKEEIEKLKEMHTAVLQFYKDRSQKLEEQLQFGKSHFRQLLRSHRLDVEGFKADIKNLKIKLVNIEKQLLKTIIQLENKQNGINLLKDMHSTTIHSVKIADDLKELKFKLYTLENELKKI